MPGCSEGSTPLDLIAEARRYRGSDYDLAVPQHRVRVVDATLMVALAVAGLMGFLLRGGGAYLWPTVDNFPYFEAQQHAGAPYLDLDLFTQAIMAPNPRAIFTSTIGAITAAAGVDYYQVFVAIGLMLSLTVPSLLYLVLSRCPLTGRTPVDLGVVTRLVLASGVALWATVFDHRVAFGSWPPLYTEATAHGVSLLLGLSGLALLWCGAARSLPARCAAWLLMTIATLYHPQNGAALWCFHAVSTFYPERFAIMRAGLRLLVWVLLPALCLTLLFTTSLSTPVDETALVQAYVRAEQPHHYDLAHIAAQKKTWINLMLAAICVAVAVAGRVHRERDAAPRLALAACFVPAVLGAQYMVNNVVMLPTLILAGPARLLMIASWFIAVAFAFGLGKLPVAGALSPFPPGARSRMGRYLIPALIALGLFVGLRIGTPPGADVDQRHLAIAQAVAAHSDPSDLVFCSDRGIARDVRHFARRAVYFSDNFPFNRDYLNEFSRRSAIYRTFLAEPSAAIDTLIGDGVDLLVVDAALDIPMPAICRAGGMVLYRVEAPLINDAVPTGPVAAMRGATGP